MTLIFFAMIDKKELEEIKKIEGKARGALFRNDFDFVERKEGSEKMRILRKRMRELGCQEEEIYQNKVKNFSWYPLRCHVLFLAILHWEMSWTEDDIFNLGHHGPKASLIFKAFPKYVLDLEKVFSKSDMYWKKNYSPGSIRMEEFNHQEKYVVFRLDDFQLHPLEFRAISGYMVGMMNLLSKEKNVRVKRIKCRDKENCHKFMLTWD